MSAAADVVDNERAAQREVLTLAAAQQAADGVRAALSAAFPAGLDQEWQDVLALLNGSNATEAALRGEVLPEEAVLFFAGKPLAADRPLSEHLGRNDKCRAVVRLQTRGAGAPPREPQLDQAGEQAMLQWWHRRQEAQRLAARAGAEAGAGLDSAEWADPGALKQAFVGISAIRLQ